MEYIKERLEAGEVVDDDDLAFFHQVLEDARTTLKLVERNPQYQEIAAKSMVYFTEIIDLALANEQLIEHSKK